MFISVNQLHGKQHMRKKRQLVYCIKLQPIRCICSPLNNIWKLNSGISRELAWILHVARDCFIQGTGSLYQNACVSIRSNLSKCKAMFVDTSGQALIVRNINPEYLEDRVQCHSISWAMLWKLLKHWGLVTHICFSKVFGHWFILLTHTCVTPARWFWFVHCT